jgi:hypothetical protein
MLQLAAVTAISSAAALPKREEKKEGEREDHDRQS